MWHLNWWPVRRSPQPESVSAADELTLFDLLSLDDGPFTRYWQRLACQRYNIEVALSAAMAREGCAPYESLFDFGEQWRAARVLCNYERDVLPVTKGKQGRKLLDEVLDDIDAIIQLTEQRWPPDVKIPRKRLPDLAKYRISQALEAKSQVQAVAFLLGYKQQIQMSAARHRPRENRRAYDVALALRAIFEHYTEFPITVAQKRPGDPVLTFPRHEISAARYDITGLPKAPFMRALDGVYSALEIDATLHHYAAKARDAPSEDPDLRHYRLMLKENPANQTQYPLVLTEFGWVKNLRTPKEVRELYANFYTHREVKAWQRKSSKTNASMMTRIRNLI